MNCRNLMVGDFIQNEHNFPMQITTVGEDYAYATFDGLEGDPWEFDDKIEPPYPIKITKEFLEKNGFIWKKRPYNDSIATLHIKERAIFIEWRLSTKSLAIWFDYETDNDGIYYDLLAPVEFVHQMQQVLRLAGMTELANNFKMQ